MAIIKKPDEYYDWGYQEEETGRVYRRMVAGLGWPVGVSSPGYCVVVAEKYGSDYGIPGSPRHLYVLAEAEGGNDEELYRYVKAMHKNFPFSNLYLNAKDPRWLAWCRNAKGESLYGTLPAGYENLTMEFVVNLIRSRADLKILHIPENLRLRGYLNEVQVEDVLKADIKQYPAIFALGCALSEIIINLLPDPEEIDELRADESEPCIGRSDVGGY